MFLTLTLFMITLDGSRHFEVRRPAASMVACMTGADAQIAAVKWIEEDHREYRLDHWSCTIGNRPAPVQS